MSMPTTWRDHERAALETARAALPRCGACGMPATLVERDVGTYAEREIVACVGCDREVGGYETAARTAKVEARYRASVDSYHRDDLRKRLRAEIEADAKRARALFREAGKPIPAWLVRLDPMAEHVERAAIEAAKPKRRARRTAK